MCFYEKNKKQKKISVHTHKQSEFDLRTKHDAKKRFEHNFFLVSFKVSNSIFMFHFIIYFYLFTKKLGWVHPVRMKLITVGVISARLLA